MDQAIVSCQLISNDLTKILETVEYKHGSCNRETWSAIMHLTEDLWFRACREVYQDTLKTFNKNPTCTLFVRSYAQSLEEWFHELRTKSLNPDTCIPLIAVAFVHIGSVGRVHWVTVAELLINLFLQHDLGERKWIQI